MLDDGQFWWLLELRKNWELVYEILGTQRVTTSLSLHIIPITMRTSTVGMVLGGQYVEWTTKEERTDHDA